MGIWVGKCVPFRCFDDEGVKVDNNDDGDGRLNQIN